VGRDALKVCRLCGEEKPLDHYYKSKARTRDGHRHECKMCVNFTTTKYYRENRENLVEKRKDYHYRRNYGITLNDFLRMSEEVGNSCEVCGDAPVVLDHCHTTGEVRGILCNKCNQALGLMRDNADLIVKLSDYLKRQGEYGNES
jgi:hypothetical protein